MALPYTYFFSPMPDMVNSHSRICSLVSHYSNMNATLIKYVIRRSFLDLFWWPLSYISRKESRFGHIPYLLESASHNIYLSWTVYSNLKTIKRYLMHNKHLAILPYHSKGNVIKFLLHNFRIDKVTWCCSYQVAHFTESRPQKYFLYELTLFRMHVYFFSLVT